MDIRKQLSESKYGDLIKIKESSAYGVCVKNMFGTFEICIFDLDEEFMVESIVNLNIDEVIELLPEYIEYYIPTDDFIWLEGDKYAQSLVDELVEYLAGDACCPESNAQYAKIYKAITETVENWG